MGSGGGGGGSAPAPDPQIGQAALKNAQTGEEWLNFAKDAYATSTERQKPIDALATQVSQQQLQSATQQNEWAQQAHDRYVDTFQPLQDQYVQEATNYDTPEKEAAAAATAKADVTSAAASQRGQSNRQMAAMGVNPASGRWAGINRATDLGTAVASAGAQNNARTQVKNTGLNLLGNAVNVGNGLPAQASQAVGLGLNAGTGSANVLNAANGQYLASTGIMNNGFQGQMQGYTNQANILQNQYNSQLQAWQTQQQTDAANNASILGGIGKIAGIGASLIFGSSKTFKTDKEPSKGNLKAVNAMPVENWRYKAGIADGGAAPHTGPYAEDFHKATGKGDGKTIPVQDMLGVTMGAVQELAGQVDRIEKAVGLGMKRAPTRGASMEKAA
ncbi:MAG: tail fiber domain-containing protein [Rhodopseudomonas sp.]|nr:tail fiber domain-containing protein [Rhodopseudomonas sp.]